MFSSIKMYKSLIFLVLICVCIRSRVNATTDEKRIYHDISSGQGLYRSNDKVYILNNDNFDKLVVNNSAAWLIEFYNSWCGHCIQYAPVWKNFASDIHLWNKVIKIGAIDCSNDLNSDLCREYEIMRYPTLRYFPPKTLKGNYGIDYKKKYNVDDLRKSIIKTLNNQTDSLLMEDNTKVNIDESWPSLGVYNKDNVFDVWSTVPKSIKYSVFFVEKDYTNVKDDAGNEEEDPNEGIEFILDTILLQNDVYFTRVKENTEASKQLKLSIIPGVAIVNRDNDIIPLTLNEDKNTRKDRYTELIKYLKVNGITIDSDMEATASTTKVGNPQGVLNIIDEELNRSARSDIVYQVDIESALRYSLTKDIAMKSGTIENERLEALKNYLKVLTKYFPFDAKGKDFLNKLNETIFTKQAVLPKEFKNISVNLANEYNPYLNKASKTYDYIGCSSSNPGYRRYPCGLWTMFHTLTVAADNKSNEYPNDDPKIVLNAMKGYIKHFFSCSDCADNFEKETQDLNDNVNSIDESILYLWKVHNSVNKRLHQYPGNITEDPQHPKIQFPSYSNCKQCYQSDGVSWNMTEVLKYLKDIYTHISYKAVHEYELSHPSSSSDKPSLRSQSKRQTNNDLTPLVIDTRYFNYFDISLCVMLYFMSVGVLCCIAVKFFFRKSCKRKKYYNIYDVVRKA